MADLTWIVSSILDCNGKECDWVKITPTGGTGSANPSIEIEEADGPDDCAEATVNISASTGEVQIIPITRCLPECSCKTMGYIIEATSIVDSAGGTIEIGKYNQNVCAEKASVEVDGIVLTGYNMSNGTITADVSACDDTEQGRTGWFNFYYDGKLCSHGTIAQGKGQDQCETATCPPSVSPNEMSFGNDGGSGAFSIEGLGECFEVNYTADSSWVNVNLSNSAISADKNESVVNKRTAHVTFVFTNIYTLEECESVPSHTITITQEHSEKDCGCDELIFESVEPEPEVCTISVNVPHSSMLPADVGGNPRLIGTYSTDCQGEPNFGCIEGEDFCMFIPSEGKLYAQTIKENKSPNSKSSRYYMEIHGNQTEFWIRQSGKA